ncbi:MAG: LysM peptidoglycan-binding domain-containing protein [Clostridiales bacterium]|jgi:LysM repeat protein|nr:LysM peptidoglycan-binding domain-containing protein [Clostridiales bacterium]
MRDNEDYGSEFDFSQHEKSDGIKVTSEQIKNVVKDLGIISEVDLRPKRETASVSDFYNLAESAVEEITFRDYTSDKKLTESTTELPPQKTPRIRESFHEKTGETATSILREGRSRRYTAEQLSEKPRSDEQHSSEPQRSTRPHAVPPRETRHREPQIHAASQSFGERFKEAGLQFVRGDAKLLLFGLFLVFLLVLMFFAFSNSNLRAEIAANKEKIEKYAELENDYNTATEKIVEIEGQNETYRSENAELKNQLELARDQIDSSHLSGATDTTPDTPATITEPQPTSPAASSPPSATQPPVNTTNRHTVGKGETLWKIAQDYYGNGNKYKDIMAANGITNENDVRAGDILILP